jgi:hypothetical protein
MSEESFDRGGAYCHFQRSEEFATPQPQSEKPWAVRYLFRKQA